MAFLSPRFGHPNRELLFERGCFSTLTPLKFSRPPWRAGDIISWDVSFFFSLLPPSCYNSLPFLFSPASSFPDATSRMINKGLKREGFFSPMRSYFFSCKWFPPFRGLGSEILMKFQDGEISPSYPDLLTSADVLLRFRGTDALRSFSFARDQTGFPVEIYSFVLRDEGGTVPSEKRPLPLFSL